VAEDRPRRARSVKSGFRASAGDLDRRQLGPPQWLRLHLVELRDGRDDPCAFATQ
jgi:hypothetical protein